MFVYICWYRYHWLGQCHCAIGWGGSGDRCRMWRRISTDWGRGSRKWETGSEGKSGARGMGLKSLDFCSKQVWKPFGNPGFPKCLPKCLTVSSRRSGTGNVRSEPCSPPTGATILSAVSGYLLKSVEISRNPQNVAKAIQTLLTIFQPVWFSCIPAVGREDITVSYIQYHLCWYYGQSQFRLKLKEASNKSRNIHKTRQLKR